jgi:hypothetical protein
MGHDRSSTRLACAALVVGSLLAVGCGPAGSADGPGASAASDGAARSAGATKAIDKQDQARAKAIRIRLADLPAGWVLGDDSDDRPNDDECDFDNPTLTETGKSGHRRDEFKGPKGASIGFGSSVYVSESDAAKALGLSVQGDVGGCLAQVLVKELRKQTAKDRGVAIDEPHTSLLDLPAHGDEQYAWQITAPFTTNTGGGTFSVDIVVFRVDRAIAAGLFSGALHPFPVAVERRLLDRLEQRAGASTP